MVRPIYAMIEIKKNTRKKYEFDFKTKKMVIARTLPPTIHFPQNYGFIEHTLAGDRDPLDVFLLGQPSARKKRVRIRPVGVLLTTDRGKNDPKIIAYPAHSSLDGIQDIEDVPSTILKELVSFERKYKAYFGQKIILNGYHGKAFAQKIIQRSRKRFERVSRTI
jgi:inorganic pyrophosphatase